MRHGNEGIVKLPELLVPLIVPLIALVILAGLFAAAAWLMWISTPNPLAIR
jgi:hypothetical protein